VRRWVLLLCVGLLAVAAPDCGLFNDLGNDWCNNLGSGGDGTGGDDGSGGDDGAGGAPDDGTGAGAGPSSSDMGAGAGPGAREAPARPRRGSPGAGVGAGAGQSTDVGAGAGSGARHALGRPRHVRRHHRAHIGTAVSADCTEPATPFPAPATPSFPAWGFPPFPPVIPVPAGAIPLTTTRLRAICTAQGIGAGKSGIQFSQDCGLRFQDWVQWMLQVQQNTTPIGSPERKAANSKNGGLPAAVIPDYVTDLKVVIDGSGAFTFPMSFFGEVKAVAGYLPPSYSQYQILGLVDVARLSAAGASTLPNHPPPELVFTTTGNTKMSVLTLGLANSWGVAIWQQIVYEDPVTPDDPNPDLCIDRAIPQNEGVYPPGVTVGTHRVNPTCTKLKSAPPNWATLIPGDPDPPMVDP
jgi:hypothetical protein